MSHMVNIDFGDRCVSANLYFITKCQALWRGYAARKRLQKLKAIYAQIYMELEEEPVLHLYWPPGSCKLPLFLRSSEYEAKVKEDKERGAKKERKKEMKRQKLKDMKANHQDLLRATSPLGGQSHKHTATVDSLKSSEEECQNFEQSPFVATEQENRQGFQSDDNRASPWSMTHDKKVNSDQERQDKHNEISLEQQQNTSETTTVPKTLQIPWSHTINKDRDDIENVQSCIEDNDTGRQITENIGNMKNIETPSSKEESDDIYSEQISNNNTALRNRQVRNGAQSSGENSDTHQPAMGLNLNYDRNNNGSSFPGGNIQVHSPHDNSNSDSGLMSSGQVKAASQLVGNSDARDTAVSILRQTSCWDTQSSEELALIRQELTDLSKEELKQQRSTVAMELLWVQQALESRKQYLRLKTDLSS